MSKKNIIAKSKNTYTLIFFLVLMFSVHVLMASFAGLWDDEAYYSLYAEYLDWGYFDHPPMIAWIIAIGKLFLHNELGVRLMSIFFGVSIIYILYDILKPKNIGLFFILFLSIIPFQLLGYLAVPDSPLLFFTILYLWAYKKFLEKNLWWQAILLGALMALCMYSKYHAILLFLLVPLSNLSLFKNIKFYIAHIVALLLYVPHLLWQYYHHFPTFKFQLVSRASREYKIFYTTDYIAGQIGVWGPLISWIVFWAFLKYKAKNKFEYSLKFIFIGILIFFLLNTYRGFIEANWTFIAFFPVFYITYKYVEDKKILIKWIYWLFPFVLALSLLARSILIFDYIPKGILYQNEFYDNPNYAKAISNVAKDDPVFFLNPYHYCSQYYFYSQEHPTSCYGGRITQFDIWRLDKNWIGKYDSLWIVQKDNPFANYKTDTSVDTRKGVFYMSKVSMKEFADSNFIKTHFDIDYSDRVF